MVEIAPSHGTDGSILRGPAHGLLGNILVWSNIPVLITYKEFFHDFKVIKAGLLIRFIYNI